MTMPPEPPEVRAALQKQLDAIQSEQPGIPIERHLVVGDEANEIIKMAADKHCDLIVMGTHGRTGLRRVLMGSIAESVLREAPCAVLTVRAPAVQK